MWKVHGEYVENCNCQLFCPCLLGPRDKRGFPVAPPTEGHCDILAGFHIEEGVFDGVNLGGLNVAMAIRTAGVMAAGNWAVVLYLDQVASNEQRAALRRIFRGEVGGPMARVFMLVSSCKERSLPIRWARTGLQRSVDVGDVLSIEVEGIRGADGTTEVWLQNVKHMACQLMASAIGRRSWLRDAGYEWSHAGTNAHYGPFAWAD